MELRQPIVRRMPKNLMMYGLEGTGLAASSNLLDDTERFGDVGSLEDNVESFLSNDGGDRRDLYVTLKQSPKQRHKDSSKGFTIVKLAPVSSLSSDGKLLASAGHDKKGGTAQVRFQPRTGQLLAAASDKIVSIFDVETDRQTYSFQISEIQRWGTRCSRMPMEASA